MIYRWNLADALPVPATRVVELDRIREYLPAATPQVTPEERAARIERRRLGVVRRFSRPL